MSYLTSDQLKDGANDGRTIPAGQTANVILTEYASFNYGPNKDKVMPKHLGKDADTNEDYEFVGFAFHDAVKQLNDSIEPGITVIRVEVLDNGTKYSDYSLSIVKGTEKKAEEKPF